MVKEPKFTISKKDDSPLWQTILIKAIAVILSLIVSALFLYFVTKLDPFCLCVYV